MGELIDLDEYRARKAAETEKEIEDLMKRVEALRVTIFPDNEDESLTTGFYPETCSFVQNWLNYYSYDVVFYDDMLISLYEEEKNEDRENSIERSSGDPEPVGT